MKNPAEQLSAFSRLRLSFEAVLTQYYCERIKLLIYAYTNVFFLLLLFLLLFTKLFRI